jgi:ankyrin repeat protein
VVSDLDKMLISEAHYGDVDKMSLLIDRGANVNGVALDCWTPLSKAADAGQLKAVRLLLARGANINQTSSGLTPLFCAALRGHLNVARLLVEKGGRLNLNPVLKKNFLDRVYSFQNQGLISLVTQVMTSEGSL